MRRREFIKLLSSAAVVWPLPLSAQQEAMPVVGLLHAGSIAPSAAQTAAFRTGLGEAGFEVGHNVAIEYRWAEGQYDRLPALAADLLRSSLRVLATGGGPAAALAAKAATSTVPIIFVSGDDPVRNGLVASLARPGGNITGVVFFQTALAAKRLELLRELLPSAKIIAYLVNQSNPEAMPETKDVHAAARTLGLELHVLDAASERDIDTAFDKLASLGVSGLLMASDPYLFSRRDQIAAQAARHSMPVMATGREYVAAGNLVSYGTSIPDAFRQAGNYAGQILKGVSPAELPVVQPTKFELIINLKTAKALGVAVPPSLLARADEVIE